MTSRLREHHLLIGGLLLGLAATLYLAGFVWGGMAVSILAVAVEVLAWVTLATDRSEGPFPQLKL